MLDLDAFLTDLASSDYAGAVSLEVDLRPALGHGARLADAMVDMRERTEDALAGARREAS